MNSFLRFIKEYEEDLDSETVFSILLGHGRTNQFLNFALQRHSYKTVILHYLNAREPIKALNVLLNIDSEKEKFALISQYGGLFMKYTPRNMIKILSNNFNEATTEKLLPSLMSVEGEDAELALDYIRSIVHRSSSKLLHNLYVFFLARSKKNDKELVDFLSGQQVLVARNMGAMIDKGFVLNVCKRFENMEAQIQVYGMLEFYEEAVKLALTKSNFELAKKYASMPSDEKMKKKLWLEVVRIMLKDYTAKDNNLAELIKESQVLTIGDLLPFVAPNIRLSAFKSDLLASLENYGHRIKELKADMLKLTKSFNEIDSALQSIAESEVSITGKKHCEVCNSPLLGSDSVFIFPCSHGFHKVIGIVMG
eukprot:TRINITY_DN9655_c0_g1_i1.p1 TRINITY_DN9655_c0_g1~~TRINITY_DN9655_c0_g1_i1.p1  ORF type:complete len:366 (-),score=100.15 TRINITY_DN9655_c0_g1_i1:168-1265(-)